jgi:hypothetical protein
LVRSRKLIYPAERMLLEKHGVSKGRRRFFPLAVVDIPLVANSNLTDLRTWRFETSLMARHVVEIKFRNVVNSIVASHQFFSI